MIGSGHHPDPSRPADRGGRSAIFVPNRISAADGRLVSES
jgi:hypothetical protein